MHTRCCIRSSSATMLSLGKGSSFCQGASGRLEPMPVAKAQAQSRQAGVEEASPLSKK